MWRLVTALRPIGWLGVVVTALGAQVVTVFAREANWGFVALGIAITFAGGVIVLRNRRVDEE
jgi:hypothetical protein